MIFLTVGTQLPFDRLVSMVDEYCGRHPGLDVFGQIGEGEYQPRHFESVPMMSLAESRSCFQCADIIISHVGIGSILTARGFGKPILMMARLAQFQEHRDNHQEQTLRHFQRMHQCYPFSDASELERVLDQTRNNFDNGAGLSPYAPENMLQELRRLLV